MGIHLLRYRTPKSENPEWGIVEKNIVKPLKNNYGTLAALISAVWHNGVHTPEVTGEEINIADVITLPPVTRPCRLMCQGVNYADHRAEASATHIKKHNLYFRKDESSILAADADIIYPASSVLLDFEVEMGLVMGRAIIQDTEVAEEHTGQYIAGVVLCNDVSLRDIMFAAPFSQWFQGKSQRASSPIGPYIYLFDKGEAAKLHDMHIRLWVNGELRQHGHTADLICRPAQALTEVSKWCDMEPGDVLMTGTPGGVAMRVPMPLPKTIEEFIASQKTTGQKWLKRGDEITASLVAADGSIDLGFQKNKII
jgi:2-keto-4-pentenoate hydratase/2-oxohepta-3-ene-1,7-dioic acid hydratase in catechol pathway